jgi:hypothetical protein
MRREGKGTQASYGSDYIDSLVPFLPRALRGSPGKTSKV